MKDYAPIKRHEALVAFSRDHHFGLLLVWKIKQGLAKRVSLQRICAYIVYCFEQDLRLHFREEEQLIFCKLSQDDELRRRAEGEHKQIYDLVNQLAADSTNERLVRRFAEALESHIRFEERSLFNHIQQQLMPGGLEDIAVYHGTQSGDLDARWGDHFWEKRKDIFAPVPGESR
jgi:hypothetical protein